MDNDIDTSSIVIEKDNILRVYDSILNEYTREIVYINEFFKDMEYNSDDPDINKNNLDDYLDEIFNNLRQNQNLNIEQNVIDDFKMNYSNIVFASKLIYDFIDNIKTYNILDYYSDLDKWKNDVIEINNYAENLRYAKDNYDYEFKVIDNVLVSNNMLNEYFIINRGFIVSEMVILMNDSFFNHMKRLFDL